MKNYFVKLFKYDRFANLQMLDCLTAANQPLKAVQLMAHLLAAQQIWLKRCKKLPAPGGPVWPDWPASELKAIIENNHAEWISFLEQSDDVDLKNLVTYQNSKVDTFENSLTDILAHLINHGTHHRAQIGQQLKLNGVEQLPVSDYIHYLRS
ncbi:DinB family protein [Mucilaginibacter sp. CSA2-8R]|uniref:DinB family protein n=1 Tax=Mucilaginibacter sp. CSA2-8R TaxID=3141542 RepID=UPI00315D3936